MPSPGSKRESDAMFFIMGINTGQKELSSHQLVICGVCGGYGRYQVFMTYTSLSLFFIPVLKWGRRYYVTMSCCKTVYELAPEMGRRIARGEQVEITPADLTLVKTGHRETWSVGTGNSPETGHSDNWSGNPAGRRRVCSNCGYETEEEFSYCPKCGRELRF